MKAKVKIPKHLIGETVLFDHCGETIRCKVVDIIGTPDGEQYDLVEVLGDGEYLNVDGKELRRDR